jgi:hypothetical protein
MQKLRLQQRLVEMEQAAERNVQAVSIGKTAAENHARRLHQRVQELEVCAQVRIQDSCGHCSCTIAIGKSAACRLGQDILAQCCAFPN